MAKSKDDIKYGTAQARHLEDNPVRVAYTAGAPLEAGKIASSETVDFYSSAHEIDRDVKGAGSERADKGEKASEGDQPQLRRRQGGGGDASGDGV